MTDRTDLLDAVDALTLPTKHRVQQDLLSGNVGDAHRKVIGSQTITVEHEPLLVQLDAAIGGDVGSGRSKGSLASERNLLDADALMKLMQIAEQVRQWCTRAGLRWTDNLSHDLRAWYASTLAVELETARIDYYVKTLRGWASYIGGKVDPQRERELEDACPVCGASTWFNPRDGIEYPRALVVQYRPVGPTTIEEARGFCRACATVWGVRALAYELEQQAEARDEEYAA